MRALGFVAIGTLLLVSGCSDFDRPPSGMRITAIEYEGGVITVALELEDAFGREVKADGRAFIEVWQEGDTGAMTTIYSATRDVEKRDFRTNEMMLGSDLLQGDLGKIRAADIESWQRAQGGNLSGLDSRRRTDVRVRFVAQAGDTLEASYPLYHSQSNRMTD